MKAVRKKGKLIEAVATAEKVLTFERGVYGAAPQPRQRDLLVGGEEPTPGVIHDRRGRRGDRRPDSQGSSRARKAAYLFTSRIGNQKVSRFIHEAFIPATMAAVNAVHGIMRNGSATAAERQALRNAVGHGEMKVGVLWMLSDALQTAPACQQAVHSLLPEVVSVALVPFRCPEAYPDWSAPSPVQRRGVGLPF